jgi:excisionase family DNA binding protein
MDDKIFNNPFAQLSTQLEEISKKLDQIASKEQVQPEKRYYDIREASQKLGVAAITLYRGCESGTIPSKKVGSRVLIPGSFVDR